MADQLESTFRTAILEEERQKAQQQGATTFSPRVGIGLVEQLAQVLLRDIGPISTSGHIHQSPHQSDFEQGSHGIGVLIIPSASNQLNTMR